MKTASANQDRFVAPEVIADYFDITEEAVRRRCREGLIPGAIKAGRLWRIPTGTADSIMQNGLP